MVSVKKFREIENGPVNNSMAVGRVHDHWRKDGESRCVALFILSAIYMNNWLREITLITLCINFYYTCMHSFRSDSDKRFLEISSAICVWFIGDNKGLHVEMKYILCYCKKDPCVWFKIIYLAIDVQDGTKWPDIRDEQRLFEMFDMVRNGQKWSDVVLIGPRCLEMVQDCPKYSIYWK